MTDKRESPSRNCAYCGCEARGVEPREQPVTEVQGDGFEVSWLNRSPMPKGTKLYTHTTAEVDALRAENAEWKNWGTIEIAIRNAAVAESMRHWEGRNEKLTAENAALRSSLAVAREALLENASYREGELSSSMDEPYAAEVAREALDKLDALDKGEAG